MSCGCNSNPCNCLPRPSLCCTPTVESVEYTFENGNILGIGVFDNDTDNLVQFRGVYSDSAALTVSLDAGNNAIKLSFDQDALVADIPDADTTTRGILETATNAEAQAKAATNKILVPSNLAALSASDTFAGLVELATDAETIAGISSTLVVTPAGLAAAAANYRTTTFADAVARAAAVPAFAGQFGTQLDTDVPFISVGTSAGNFSMPILVGGGTNTLVANTTIDVATGTLTFTNGFVNSDAYHVFFDNRVDFGKLGQPQIVDFYEAQVNITATPIPADSVVITSGVPGYLSSSLINTFISSANTQTGYTAFTNPATIRTCDTSTVTLQQLAQLVGTLISDLKLVKLPAT